LLKALIFFILLVGDLLPCFAQQKKDNYAPVLVNDLPVIDTARRFSKAITSISPSPEKQKSINRTQNSCGVTASFTPGVDSFFTTPTFIVFTSNSVNATSFQWYVNGIWLGQLNFFSMVFNVGYHDVSLIASNGNCRDTFSVTVVCTGIEPTDKRYFSGSFGFPYTQERGEVITAAADSGFLLGGAAYISPFPFQNNALLIKLKKGGCIEWSKILVRENYTTTLHQVYALRDSGYLISGTVAQTNFVMRTDKTGNPQWVREYITSFLWLGFTQLYEMNDGSLVAATSPFSNGFSIVKLDAQGNLLWNKFLQKELDVFDYTNSYAICEMQNELYVGGTFKMRDTSINHTAPFNSFIVKLNSSNGQVIWSKMFQASGPIDYRSIALRDLQVYDDTTLIFSANNYNTLGGATTHPSLHWINANGNISRSFAVNQNTISLNFPAGVKAGVLPGGNIMLFYKGCQSISLQPGFINHYNFFKIGRDSTILFNMHSSASINDLHNKLSFNGRAFGTIGPGYGQLVPYFAYSENFLFSQRDSSGIDNGCGYPDNTYSVQPYNVQLITFNWVKDSVLPVNVNPVTLLVKEVYPQMRSSCPDYIDSCSILKIRGKKFVCDLNTTYTYKAGKNRNCPKAVQWTHQGSMTVIDQTDSSITVKFNAFGNFMITAFLDNSCNPVKDSIIIVASSKSDTLNLGIDTSICTGNSITLHASPHFLSYQWQDGSTDSLFTASMPGMYWVNVVDSCGNTLRDSINILAGATVALYAGPDRVKCNNDTLHLSAPGGFLNYSWSNNYNISSLTSQNVIVNPDVDTAYYLKAERTPGCFGYDTLRVSVYHSPPINIGRDTSFCINDSVRFDAGLGFINYLWSNGAITQDIIAKTSGNFSVIGTTLEGCKSYDTARVLNIWQLPTVTITGGNKICRNSFTTLNAGTFPGLVSYHWSNGSNSSTINVTSTGIYSVAVADENACTGRDTIVITGILDLPSNFLFPDTAICSYETIDLKASNSYRTYLWNTGSSASSIKISTPGLYWLRVTDYNNCVGEDTVKVNAKECPKGFYMPSAFTPNGDGKNDMFGPTVFGKLSFYDLIIYNRWGEIVFQAKEITQKWNGAIKGVGQNSGIFVWMCTYQFEGEAIRMEKGTLTLLR
jgi:gliding motility-associated-like protein